jgi:two-component system chemotaxis response regulator CheB
MRQKRALLSDSIDLVQAQNCQVDLTHALAILLEILGRAGTLPALHLAGNAAIAAGQIYVAVLDHHLIEREYMRVVRGPKENRHRPAIDPLFRSAARTYRLCIAGVILSGRLDDGTTGLLAIKRCDGVSVVQHPQEAHYLQMPQSALNDVQMSITAPERTSVSGPRRAQ